MPSNIAEGYGRLSRDQYKHFLGVAQASNFELQTQLLIANKLGCAEGAQIALAESTSCEVGKMLTAILKKL